MSEKETDNKVSGELTSQPLISEENFQLLCDAQRRLSQQTSLSPKISVLVNLLITEARILEVEQQLKSQLSKLFFADVA